MTDEEASVASSSGEQQPESEEEPEGATDPSVGLYLAEWARAQPLIEDAKRAALVAYYAREAQFAAAERVLEGLVRLDPEQWTCTGLTRRMEATFGISRGGGSSAKDKIMSSYLSHIANDRATWPYLLLRAEAVLDVVLRVEKAARDAGGVSEIDQLTSLLASASVLRTAPEPLRRYGHNNRLAALDTQVRAAGVSFDNGVDCIISALVARLEREPASVRAANAWARAERRLPRGNAAADAWLAGGILTASLDYPETLAPQNADEVAIFESWEGDEDAHQEALDEWNSWTLAEPSSFASVGLHGPGLRFDYRVDGLDAPTAESYPRRPSGAPTVVQPASALPLPESLHGLVDGVVKGERRNEWRWGA